MKRRELLFRAPHPESQRGIRYDDWPTLIGGRVEIRRHGTVIQTGVVEMVMPDSSALRLTADPMQERRYFSKSDGFEVWISPRDLQPLISKAPVLG
ncbi:hypothetical protein ACFVYC_07555 [Pseudarthrobacter sp. NPDC058329]|uniref:hypothetical protein n=1 Tax=Pseudarthrobacter sp. NPDC058329 TaxID=3346448 RepID=UPI0036D7901A